MINWNHVLNVAFLFSNKNIASMTVRIAQTYIKNRNAVNSVCWKPTRANIFGRTIMSGESLETTNLVFDHSKNRILAFVGGVKN